MLPLKPPQRPRSLVTTKTSIFRPSRFCKQRMGEAVDALTQIGEHAAHFVRIGTGGQNAIL